MSERNGLSEKQFLTALSSKLKQVLNPTFYHGDGYNQFVLSTDIHDFAKIGIQIKGIGLNSESDTSIINFLGFFDTQSTDQTIYGMNLGKSLISLLGYRVITINGEDVLLIAIKADWTEQLSVEVFRYDETDNKNHCVSISEEELDLSQWVYTENFSGETYPNFNLSVNCGEDKEDDTSCGTHIINAFSGSDYIDKVQYSDKAYALKEDVNFTINNSVNNARIIGEGGVLQSGSTNIDLILDISPTAIQEIASEVEIPLATTIDTGGIKLADSLDSFMRNNPNFYKVDLKGPDSDKAVVDLTNIQNQIDSINSNADIHRYSDMSQATIDHPVLGSIVQYIGNTTNDYIHGYFYMRVYEKLIGSLEIGSYWSLNGSLLNAQTLLNAGLTQYNKEHDYLLKVNQVEISPKLDADATITSETEFNVVNDYCSDVVTYAKLLEWGITLNNLNYQQASADNWKAVIILTSDNSEQPIWTLKNVQPAIHMQSALMYKGVLQHFADLEDKTLTAQPGDFYTIADRSNQEWFFNGTITSNWEDSWEYMGEIITIPEYTEGDAISINDHEISVKYDSSTLGTNDNGELTVSPDLDYSEGENISISSGREISANGYKWDPDNKSFAEGKFTSDSISPAEGKYSHAEGRETKTHGQASHAEGYNTIAEGKASHVEGFGILCNTSNFSWEYTASHDATIKIIISESEKTNLTLANEFYFANLFDFVEKSIYSRATKLQENFSIKYIGINNGETEFDPTPGYYDDTNVNQITVYLAVDTSIFLDEGETFDIIIPVYADELAAHAEGKNTYAQNKNSHTEGLLTQTLGENSHAEGHLTFINGDGYNAHAEGYNTRAMKNQAHSEGANTQAYGENSHVEGEEVCAWGKDSHAEGKSSTSPALYNDTYFDDSLINVYNEWAGCESDDDSYSCAWGNVSHVEGKNNLALGNNSHAEGQGTCAYGDKSHAEGSNTLAKSNNTHAEGDEAKAIGFASHAEGTHTTANGGSSHVEGIYTVTNNDGEHAEGTYNVSHLGTIHSIGIGDSIISGGAKNAFEVMNNGDAYLYGVGNYLGTDIKASGNNIKTLQESLGDKNVIESIKVNGSALTPVNKTVDITVPVAQVNSDWNSNSGVSEILNKPNLTTVATSGKYSDLTGIPATTLLGPACMYPSNANPYKEEWERSWVIEGPNISYGRGCYIYPKNHFDNMIICEGAANDSTSEKDERLRILVFPSDKYAADEKIRITIGNDYTNHNVGIVLRAGTQQDEFYFLNELVNDKYIDVKLSNDTFPVTIDSNTTLTVRAIDLFSSGATCFTWDSTNSSWAGSDSYMTKLPELKILQHPV